MICQRNFSFAHQKLKVGAGTSIIELQFEVHTKAVPPLCLLRTFASLSKPL
jgi:hypothetical protein